MINIMIQISNCLVQLYIVNLELVLEFAEALRGSSFQKACLNEVFLRGIAFTRNGMAGQR
ncbi:hypothetical protein AUQ37_06260 [Candidatus Methanomethylophilus sp. 1R26]|nr:hypothetical protein AUQ37_06260 [Candidatus Methanomethylophilus sp. 1R26]